MIFVSKNNKVYKSECAQLVQRLTNKYIFCENCNVDSFDLRFKDKDIVETERESIVPESGHEIKKNKK